MGIDTEVNRAVFLDRDGVLNRAFVRQGILTPPRSLDEFEILPGVPQALQRLRESGLRLIVVTNQPDVARGLLNRKTVEQMHERLTAELTLDGIRACYHDDVDGCDCRKPKPGMLVAAAQEFDIDLGASFIIGDSWRDVEAGRLAGCYVVLIEHAHSRAREVRPDVSVGSISEAADWILSHKEFEGV